MGEGTGEVGGRTMQIGEVAERVGLSLRSIRHYDDVGLVPPSARSEGGFRLYTEDDVERLRRVKHIVPLGFSLEETSRMLELLESGAVGDDPAVLDGFLERARRGRETLARKLAQADELLAELEGLAH
ncbi:Regulatory protein, MerR [Micrococcus lylae]|uniref:MerR family transcriptional regulator n=1 Tax=Micrococcus lylae TaxID=1273 RepID=A0A1R4IZY6_9MICC|nr:MerR family transcriptional regulator [Micrococcus lylae]MCT2007467.1 MerR family transcriptional regulator [Micrococcus lylae]MCT2070455.1 MerR family transcriptional regulator [Micrococcus lylae]TFH99288.1 MerR family transcriptional regulator [Micrococcus lylae]WIK81614.1 MerR family transcriptional regulator [Micrococcus lylae]SJN25244.1 Regulatory protein, MerR [Micrococcus lylae]